MTQQGTSGLRTESIRRSETCAIATVRRVAAMLNLDQDVYGEGDRLPRGWQFILFGADTPRGALRGDGFPGLGVPLPDLGLPRLLLGGRRVQYFGDITIGETLQRESYVEKVSQKETANGPMAVVTIAHNLISEKVGPVLAETQTYLLMSAQTGARKMAEGQAVPPIADAAAVTPDDMLLFQYSALGFNSHRIHWDRAFACDTEGFPDLVVNGGLVTLLLTEHLRVKHGQSFSAFTAKHMSPFFASRPLYLVADAQDNAWMLRAFDDAGRLALEIEAVV
ncbi:MaoC family dehydratase N-terminal domain-containing protein [Mesorhizobium sp. YR577]|uniref:FAS1-like dehydratase domain-containing protein n=1 Tax=Mesorhizobium sp. YR577 TaxID=1884373 RepID=UPI0008E8E655|nr:MaoC family dehydratase N-terminal domain-containing protein [Mesorhizobium sp. YR577]SFU17267.1 3-methylfumaryl-CoA hydratase [Mesorhizobium sp. YR577]